MKKISEIIEDKFIRDCTGLVLNTPTNESLRIFNSYTDRVKVMGILSAIDIIKRIGYNEHAKTYLDNIFIHYSYGFKRR